MATTSAAPSAQVLELLQDSPGRVFSPAEIADETGLTGGQVSAALQHLHRQYAGRVVNRRRGEWLWQETPAIVPDGSTPVVATADVPHSFETISIHSSGGVVIRDEHGGVWLAVPMLPTTSGLPKQ